MGSTYSTAAHVAAPVSTYTTAAHIAAPVTTYAAHIAPSHTVTSYKSPQHYTAVSTVCSDPSTLPRTALFSTLLSARLRPSGSTPPSTTPLLLSPLCTTTLSPWSTLLPMLLPPPPSDTPTPPTSVFAPTMLARGLPAKPCRDSTFKTAISPSAAFTAIPSCLG